MTDQLIDLIMIVLIIFGGSLSSLVVEFCLKFDLKANNFLARKVKLNN